MLKSFDTKLTKMQLSDFLLNNESQPQLKIIYCEQGLENKLKEIIGDNSYLVN